ncbi:MAG: beta-lactamase family protein [Acidobacteria bacterium]|nr:beta-lactamase family protein [Acidobacteriota bacterium]
MRITFFRTSLLALSVVLLFTLSAQADRVDDLIKERLRERNIPGAAVAVVKNGKVEKIKAYGVASVEFNVLATTETVFEIGSVSKQMTAAGIMLLVEEGKVDLDERISKYLPNTPSAWADVTVRHLLTHTSGIKSYSSLSGFNLSRRVSMEGFIEQLAPYPLEFIPGEKNIYSNSGYNLLAYIIQTQSGKPFMEFMQERIFKPLGMTKTADRDPQFIIPLRATGYEWQRGSLSGRDGNLTDLMGAGSIVSTISDMTKWEAALRGDKFLKPSSKKEMWTQFTFNDGKLSPYGLGWRISDVRGHKLIGHTGQTAGFGAAIFRYVDDDVSVIALTNLGEIGMGGMLASGIAKIFISSLSIKKMKAIKIDDNEIDKQIVTSINNFIAGTPSEELLTPQLFRTQSSPRIISANSRLKDFGAVKNSRLVGTETIEKTTIYRYLSETPKRSLLWRVEVNENRKISAMVLEEEE